MFDSTRMAESFVNWSDSEVKYQSEDGLIYRYSHSPGAASYCRGVQIIGPSQQRENIISRIRNEDKEPKEYASFIAVDWKNERIDNFSCDPSHLANYFVNSPLPYETTPAFFRAEVLSKYKADTDKYNLSERSISCRGAWHLETYDINEAGQVHTYLIYLSRLPYEEQMYWKAYNEPPKGPISNRAFKTDFEGRWDEDYNALSNLKTQIQKFDRLAPEWWKPRNEKIHRKVQYPATNSPDEWASELLNLDHLVVEGFQERSLRKRASGLGQTPDERFRSLKLVEECLIGLGYEEGHAKEVVEPLRNLHELRSKLKGHASGSEADSIRQELLIAHGSYREHFVSLCRQCDIALRSIAAALEDRD